MVNLKNDKQSDNLKRLNKELPNAINSENDSFIYTKKIIVTAISNILFVRNVFEESCYTLREFEGLLIRLIEPKSKQKGITILSKWIEGAFEALDKKYLKCISLSFFENLDKPEHVLETYDFDLKYTNTDAKVTLTTNESSNLLNEAKFNAKDLIKTILCITNGLNDLPSRVCINMRLFYYEDVTPLDYEPTGFRNDDFEKYKFENDERIQFQGGSLNTKWIQMKVNVNASKSMIRMDCENFVSVNETFSKDDTLQMENYDLNAKTAKLSTKLNKTIDYNTNMITNKINDLKLSKPKLSLEDSSSIADISSNFDQSRIDSDTSLSPIVVEKQISCGCTLKDMDEVNLIQCEICSNWQHAICYNILINDDKTLAKLNHCCHTCHLKSNGCENKETDKEFYEQCMFNRVLIWLSTQEKFVIKSNLIQEFNLKESTYTKIYNTLEGESVLKVINKNKNKYQINHNALQVLIDNNFIKRLSQKEVVTSSKDMTRKKDKNSTAGTIKRRRQTSTSREPIIVDAF